MKHPRPGLRRQQGMLLPALVVLLAVSVTGWLLARQADGAAARLAREQRTAQALKQAREALIGFAANYRNAHHPDADFGYLPCPDLNGDGSAETCGTKDETSVGRLPYLTLGLPDLRDGNGECLWYAVSGSFKNNPKPDILNWDSTGRFRILDEAGAPLVLPGDQLGLAAAVIFAPGAPLPEQSRSPGDGRCGGDLPASAIQHYLEAIRTRSGKGIIDVTTAITAESNDRIAWITGGDIYRQLKANGAFARHIQQVIAATAGCLVHLPPPAGIETTGATQLGRIPAFADNTGPCNSATMRDATGNWTEMMRYVRCSDGSACLADNSGSCRGAVLFGGERLPGSQRRVEGSDKLATGQYLEPATQAAIAAHQLASLTSTFAIPFAARQQVAATDIAVCIP